MARLNRTQRLSRRHTWKEINSFCLKNSEDWNKDRLFRDNVTLILKLFEENEMVKSIQGLTPEELDVFIPFATQNQFPLCLAFVYYKAMMIVQQR